MVKERKLMTELIDRDPRLAGEADLQEKLLMESKKEYEEWLKAQINEKLSGK